MALIELNVSCPNVETGLIMGADPCETQGPVERLRPLTGKPLIVKLTRTPWTPRRWPRRRRLRGRTPWR